MLLFKVRPTLLPPLIRHGQHGAVSHYLSQCILALANSLVAGFAATQKVGDYSG